MDVGIKIWQILKCSADEVNSHLNRFCNGVFCKLLWNVYQTKFHTVPTGSAEFEHIISLCICAATTIGMHSIRYLRITLKIKWRGR
jgi:hypothetical protein